MTTVAANPSAEPLLHRLPAHDLGRLSLGLYCAFWGTLLVVAGLCESLATSSWRALNILLLLAGHLSLVLGAWRLHQVDSLGDSWRRRTREALVASILLAYLAPFFILWRQVPANLYFLGHGLALLGIFYYWIALMCQVAGVLGRAAGRRGLLIQAIVFGTISVLLLFPPFGILTNVAVMTARNGADPFAIVQFWMQRSPVWLLFLLLLPFPLTLSLLWTAKDVVLGRLLERP